MFQLFTPLAQDQRIVPLLSIGLFVLLCLWIWARAGSAHFLLDRLWRIAAGRREAQDSVLREIHQESRDLEIFRFSYRVPVQTIADLHQLNGWAKDHNVGIRRLSNLWRWVDVRDPQVVLRPKRMVISALFPLLFALVIASMCAGSLLASSSGFFHMKESEVWFKTDGNTVRNVTLWGDSWVFAAADCAVESPEVLKKTGFRKSELVDLCTVLANGSMKDQVRSLVPQQQWLALILLLPSLMILVIVARATSGALEAAKLWKELYGNKDKESGRDVSQQNREASK